LGIAVLPIYESLHYYLEISKDNKRAETQMNKLLQMQFSDFKQRFAHGKFMRKQTIGKKSIKISSDCRNKV